MRGFAAMCLARSRRSLAAVYEVFKGSDALCARRNLFVGGLGWLKPRMELPRRVSVNANHRRYENRTLNFGLGYAMDFLTSAR